MDYAKIYKEKLTTAEEAVKVVRNDDWVDYGWCVNTVVSLDKALSKRMPELENINLRGGVLMWRPTVFDTPNPAQHFTWNSWHMGGADRKVVNEGFSFYAPLRYSELPRYYREVANPSRVAMFQVSSMDEHGFFNFGPSASHLTAMCERAEVVIVEVNKNIPRCLGGFGEGIHVSQVDMIVEGDNPPLGQLPSTQGTEVDKKVAEHIVKYIHDGCCIQLGIGGMPNEVGKMIAASDLKDLGVHTEMYVDAFVDMAMAGKISGAKKNIDRYRQTYAFGAGTQKMYDYINNNPECMSVPVDYTNDTRTISSIDNMISINNAVDVDLYGQVSSESSGIRQISGQGGQLDFVLGAYLSKGGKSFICCSATYKGKDGNLQSRLVPTLEPGSVVTDTRTNIHWLVTEYGAVNLKGLSSWQRAEAIISVAHPQFHEELIQAAEKMNIWRKSNKKK